MFAVNKKGKTTIIDLFLSIWLEDHKGFSCYRSAYYETCSIVFESENYFILFFYILHAGTTNTVTPRTEELHSLTPQLSLLFSLFQRYILILLVINQPVEFINRSDALLL